MPNSDERHPVLAGLIALVAVSVAVALIVGISAFAAAHVLHLGGSDSSGSGNDGASLYLPRPSPTLTGSGPLVTLSSQPTSTATGSGHASSSPSSSASSSRSKPDKRINLTAGEVSVAPMQPIDLSGTFDGGEGHLLRVQRKSDGTGWEDFPVPDVDVEGGQFSTSVETGRTGKQLFRVKDDDTGEVSNVVSVTVG